MKNTLSVSIHLFIGLVSFGSWLFMAVFSHGSSMLTAASFSSLKYFTVLSNLLNGMASLIYVYQILSRGKITHFLQILKLTSTAAVTLTFLTVICFLGPVFGYSSMFQGANFWLHLVLPLLSIISFITIDAGDALPFSHTFYALLPTLLYEAGYLLNIAVHGKGEWPASNDFYGFLSWGNGVGAVIVVVMLLVTWGIACSLRFLRIILHSAHIGF